MRNGNADEIAKLIEPGRVHRRVYADPDVFELEMERIFGRAWLFVGHGSQVPNPGDYITTDLGRHPIDNVQDFSYVLNASKPGETVTAIVLRDGHELRLSVTFQEGHRR